MAQHDSEAGRDSQIEFIAHRGSSFVAPENTLAAFLLGWVETTMCELDIRPTRDGSLLVIHDESTKRTTGVDLQVSDCSMSELQKLDAGTAKGARWRGEKLPSLEEVLLAMTVDKRLLIEIKAGPEVLPELERVLRVAGKGGQIHLQSFNYACCGEARKTFPALPIFLLAFVAQEAEVAFIDDCIEKAKAADLTGLGLNDSPLINAATVKRIHEAGLKLNIWTVDELSAARRLIDCGVKGLITNRPGWLKKQLGFGE
jgi:glycerophosphoryl diester phosphodiesterase